MCEERVSPVGPDEYKLRLTLQQGNGLSIVPQQCLNTSRKAWMKPRCRNVSGTISDLGRALLEEWLETSLDSIWGLKVFIIHSLEAHFHFYFSAGRNSRNSFVRRCCIIIRPVMGLSQVCINLFCAARRQINHKGLIEWASSSSNEVCPPAHAESRRLSDLTGPHQLLRKSKWTWSRGGKRSLKKCFCRTLKLLTHPRFLHILTAVN